MSTVQQAIAVAHPIVIREWSATASVGLESAADALAAAPVPDAAPSAIVPGAAVAALHTPAAAIGAAAAAAAAAVGRAAAEVAAGAALDVRRGAGRSAAAAAARGAITNALVAARVRVTIVIRVTTVRRVTRVVADVVPATAARSPPRRAGASRHHLDGTRVLHLGARALTIGDAVRPARAAVIEAAAEAAETWAEHAAARESAEAQPQVEATREIAEGSSVSPQHSAERSRRPRPSSEDIRTAARLWPLVGVWHAHRAVLNIDYCRVVGAHHTAWAQ